MVGILLLLSVGNTSLSAQNNPQEDSLLTALATQLPNDTNRVLTLNALFAVELDRNLEAALKYEEEAFDLALRQNFQTGILYGTNNLGVIYLRQGNYPEALKYHTRLYEMVVENRDSAIMAVALINIGTDHYSMGSYSISLSYYESCLELNLAMKDSGAIRQTLNNMGSCYMEQGNYPEALEYYFKALELAEKRGNEAGSARTLSNIGIVYLKQNQDSISLSNFTQALSIYGRLEDNIGMIMSLRNLGDAYFDRQDYVQAEEYFNQALDLCISTGQERDRLEVLWMAAESRLMQGNKDKVLEDYFEAENAYQESESVIGQAKMKGKIGHFYFLENRNVLALKQFEECEVLSTSIGARELTLNSYAGRAKAYAGLSNYNQAYYFQKKFQKLFETIHSGRKSMLIAEMRQKYEAQKQEQEISKLSLEKANVELRLSRSRAGSYFLGGGIGLLILIAIFLIYTLRLNNKSAVAMAKLNLEIEEQRRLVEAQNKTIREINSGLEVKVDERTHDLRLANQELDSFLYESAHALRRPITTTKGLITLMEMDEDPGARKSLRDKVDFTLDRMDRMLHKLILINENSRIKVKPETLNLNDILSKEIKSYDREKLIEWSLLIDENQTLQSDRYRVSAIFRNVLENAVFFRAEGGKPSRIRIQVQNERNGVSIKIHDNGIGINKKVVDQMMNMFQRGTELSKGNGLGLFVVKKFVNKLKGKVSLTSEEGAFSEVSIWLPNLNA